jgi:hypothetical protein
MAQQLSKVQQTVISYSIAVIDAIPTTELLILTHAALLTVRDSLEELLPTPAKPAAAPNQAAPPAAPVLTITEVDGPTPPIRAHAHDAAVKAAATRKANKAKSAGSGEKIGADTKAPEPSNEPAVTE